MQWSAPLTSQVQCYSQYGRKLQQWSTSWTGQVQFNFLTGVGNPLNHHSVVEREGDYSFNSVVEREGDYSFN